MTDFRDPKYLAVTPLGEVAPQTVLRGKSGRLYIRLAEEGQTDRLRGDWIGWFKIDPDGHLWSVVGMGPLLEDQPLQQVAGWATWEGQPREGFPDLTDDELHEKRAHPDYEYATTTSPRKSGVTIRPQGDGWEPNPRGVVYRWANDAGEIVEQGARSWERFEYHEEEYWMRLKVRPGPAAGHDFRPVAGHPDDDECTHCADGTDATYCGMPREEHRG